MSTLFRRLQRRVSASNVYWKRLQSTQMSKVVLRKAQEIKNAKRKHSKIVLRKAQEIKKCFVLDVLRKAWNKKNAFVQAKEGSFSVL